MKINKVFKILKEKLPIKKKFMIQWLFEDYLSAANMKEFPKFLIFLQFIQMNIRLKLGFF